jgi:tRNA G18 (ribose-2'-O)-methylase SpoU
MIFISQVDDQRVSHYIRMQKNDDQTVVLDGRRVIQNYLKYHNDLRSIFISENFYEHHKEWVDTLSCTKYMAPNSLMEKILGYKFHCGVMGHIMSPTYSRLEDIDGNVLVLNGVSGPENVGTICRNAKAFNFKYVLFDSHSSNPFFRRPARVSIGHVFTLKVIPSLNLKADLEILKTKGFKVVGTSVQGTPLKALSGKKAVVFGAEGDGMYPEIGATCDLLLKIETVDNISINVGSASAIILSSLNSSH